MVTGSGLLPSMWMEGLVPEIIVAHELNNNVERIRHEPFFTKLMCFITVNNCKSNFDNLLCKIIHFLNIV